jgi:hypothetical protein
LKEIAELRKVVYQQKLTAVGLMTLTRGAEVVEVPAIEKMLGRVKVLREVAGSHQVVVVLIAEVGQGWPLEVEVA